MTIIHANIHVRPEDPVGVADYHRDGERSSALLVDGATIFLHGTDAPLAAKIKALVDEHRREAALDALMAEDASAI